MKKLPLLRLRDRGHAHIIMPLLVIAAVGLAGFYVIVGSHADSVKTKVGYSTYFLYSHAGDYPYMQVTSSANFKGARCNGKQIANGKHTKILEAPKESDEDGTYAPLALYCVTPNKDTDTYYINFYTLETKPDSGIPDTKQAVAISDLKNSCLFVHATTGVTERIVKQTANSRCVLTSPNEDPGSVAVVTKRQDTAKGAATLKIGEGDLVLPPNFDGTNRQDAGKGISYFFMPRNDDTYLIHTPGVPKQSNTDSSPADHRYGRIDLIRVFYTVAYRYHQKYPDSKLVMGDLNAPYGHESHRNGIDMDIYTVSSKPKGQAALISSAGGDDKRNIVLAHMLIDTGKIEFILFNGDRKVQNNVNNYKSSPNKHYHAPMHVSNESHDFHMHIRINDRAGRCTHGSASECDAALNLSDIF